eukprot:COSAG06_NODE_258_length_18940_cov_15.039648_16_plen_193_part_00
MASQAPRQAAWSAGGGDANDGRRDRIWRAFGPSGSREPRRGIDGRRERHRAEAWSQQRHSSALLRRSATARAAKRRQLHQPNLGSQGRPTPRWQPLHASYAAGAADLRSRAPRTLFLAATAARCVIQCAAPAQCYCARGETAAVTPAKSRQRRAPDPAMAAPPRQLRSWRSRRAQPRPLYPLSGRHSRQVRN